MKIVLIIPTYNEVKNIKFIYKKIRKYNSNLKILFIDDNSPDRTIEIIKLLSKKDKNIFYLLRKKKLGIGSAHKFGIKWAIKNGYNLCITMDADLTHNPKLIPRMIKLSKKFEVIQTNRFFKKKYIETWPLHRKILTKIRYIVLYLLLGVKQDSSSAFRCYNFNLLDYRLIFLAKNNSYSFFWESMFIFNQNRCLIKEIGTIMNYRKLGSSKINFIDYLDGLYFLIIVFFKRLLYSLK